MKTIRYLAGILLVITGVWHVALFLQAPGEAGNLPLLIFGILYGLTGVLLFTPGKLWIYLGLAFPLIGMTSAIIKLGIKSFDTTMWILILIDVAVIVCCAYLILKRNKAV